MLENSKMDRKSGPFSPSFRHSRKPGPFRELDDLTATSAVIPANASQKLEIDSKLLLSHML
jgi:hypothetical protein